MNCPHCARPVAIDDDSCPHCGLRMPPGRADLGADSGCGIAVIFLLILLVGTCLFSGLAIPWWLRGLF